MVVSLLKLAVRVQRGREEPFLLAIRALSTAWNRREVGLSWKVGMVKLGITPLVIKNEWNVIVEGWFLIFCVDNTQVHTCNLEHSFPSIVFCPDTTSTHTHTHTLSSSTAQESQADQLL